MTKPPLPETNTHIVHLLFPYSGSMQRTEAGFLPGEAG